ncbi:DUF559 domain-containing protein [Demequina sp. TTPB684]|uniref:endonuclease domain-containing protein n=1 Tax=unclassified Demequina TaxID=2620311 RepID=UPI001CF0F9C9|nr:MULTISPECIES: DUF559 domain-containing protein [unclassified Demequina]MCB2412077.1 DUF559 domain-containing protein [Demequina sp. TTPB684]UPU88632.1 DUF559 domain-containing protein [Demequina sp. TMPB413]
MRTIAGLTHLDQPLTRFLSSNQHAFTRADLLSRWTRTALERAVEAGTVTRILPAVYCSTEHRGNPLVRAESLNLWHPAGLVTGALALHLYASELQAPSAADLRVTSGFRPHATSWVRCRQGAPVRFSSSPRGVQCTEPAMALLDAWRFALPDERINLLYEALWARVCTWRQLQRELERAPRVAGRRDLQRVLSRFAEGATTPLEVRAKHEVFADDRFREFEWQVDLRLGSRRVVADMLHRRAMVAVEFDGDRYHSTRQARDEDRERQTELAAAGYLVIRFGWSDVTARPGWCRERLLSAVSAQLARPAGT